MRVPLPASFSLSNSRVLVVDDNDDAAQSLALVLQTMGGQTCVANDGVSALEAAATFHPDLILLDIGLPQLSGHDVCRRIRQQPWGRSIRMVALSGWEEEAEHRKSREAGFDLYLVKPVEMLTLKRILAEMVAHA